MSKRIQRVIVGVLFPIILGALFLMIWVILPRGFNNLTDSNSYKLFILAFFVQFIFLGIPALICSAIVEFFQSILKSDFCFYVVGGFLCGVCNITMAALFFGESRFYTVYSFFIFCVIPGIVAAVVLREMYQSSSALLTNKE
ncbi:hypothetical protein [Microbulbifer sp. THAF38]|uniref:hypothetical protein n=1 Tax=Microbulbifer sp. THAF38 TaxID=2587856 RepID=UPI0012688A32|nr:hypothetical protein [Microbulbifer sp. THAF38]